MDGEAWRMEPAVAARPGPEGPQNARALVVSSLFPDSELKDRVGREAYSYRFVYRAFAPLLRRWGRTVEVTRPESRLDYALWQARRDHLEPLHLAFGPLHLAYLTARAPNIIFPFWEFPNIPNTSFANNPRNNWVRLTDRLALILTACTFTRDAFVRAGVKAPVQVVPVPIRPDYFDVPAWEPRQRCRLDVPAYVFPLPEAPAGAGPNPWEPARITGLSLRARARQSYKCYIKPRLPARLDRYLTLALRSAAALRNGRQEDVRVPYPERPALDLTGVVYTTILNPFDPRKNWQDLLTAFLLALGDREDATLVMKLVVCPKLAAPALNGVIGHYQGLGIRHRCKLALVAAYLSDPQMTELARASTYYINTARAEGACLPLQDFLAAGRPGVAPGHTALADYFGDELGFVIASHPEPAAWPHDPRGALTTRWHRMVWQALFDQIRASYEVAVGDRARYRALAGAGRSRMADYASALQVWPRLAAALDLAAAAGDRRPDVLALPEPIPVRRAS